MTTPKDNPGRKTGQQGREELTALSDEELNAKAAEFGVKTTNDDGTPRDREGIVNNLANKMRQAERGQPKGDGEDTETETETAAES